MASLTSLYLCSRTVYAAVGSPTARGARITAAASTQLPEGCLINGVITNEADLAEALKAFFCRQQAAHRPRGADRGRLPVHAPHYGAARHEREKAAGRALP